MTYRPCSLKAVNRIYRRYSNHDLLESFARGTDSCAKIENSHHSSASSCASSLYNSCKHFGFDKTISVVTRHGEVYLVKKADMIAEGFAAKATPITKGGESNG